MPEAKSAKTLEAPCDCTWETLCMKNQGTLAAGFYCRHASPVAEEAKHPKDEVVRLMKEAGITWGQAQSVFAYFDAQPATPSHTREAEVELPPRPTAINATIEEATRYIRERVYLQFAMDPYIAALEARIAQLESELDTCRRQGRPHP